MTTYLLRARIDAARRAELGRRRAEHLAHIEGRAGDITFGGVVGPADGPPEEILIVLAAASADDVREWAERDPYAELYATVEVDEFHLRRPFAT